MNRVVKNASWIIICRICQSILALVIGTISARYLGPSNYGLISYAASVAAFVLPICQLGFTNVLVEEAVNNPEDSGRVFGTTILLSILTSVACIAGIVSFVFITNRDSTETVIVCALYSLTLFFQTTEMIQYWFQAKLLSKYTSITSLVAYAVVSIYKIILLVTHKSVYWFAFSTCLDYFVISVVLVFYFRKISGQKFSFSWTLGKKLYAKSKYYIVPSMMVTIFSCTDKIMIKSMIGNAENGYYSAVLTCATMTAFVFAAIIDSVRPVIFEKKKTSYSDYEKSVSQLYSVIFYLGVAQGIVLTVFSPIVINILYGQAYSNSIIMLRILPWYIPFSYFGSIRNIWMLAEKKQHYLWVINLIGSIMNVVGNYFLIPIMGGIGASIATVFTQLFTNFVLSLAITPIRRNGVLMLNGLDPRAMFVFAKTYKKHRRDDC